MHNINLIREESDILNYLPCPIEFEDLNKLVENLQHRHQNRFVERVQKMHDKKENSPYQFRYVVGEIVSEQWINQFEQAPNAQARKDMLDNFQAYLDNTHNFNLNSACENLLGKDFLNVTNDYIKAKKNEKLNQGKLKQEEL